MRRRKSSKSWVVHPSEDQPVQEPAVTTQKCSVGTRQARPSVAIVGSGIAGNAAAYYLRGDYDVTIFEAASRVSGPSAASAQSHLSRSRARALPP